MNFYKLFYLFTVSERLQHFLDFASNLFTVVACIVSAVFVIWFMVVKSNGDPLDKYDTFWITNLRRIAIWNILICLVFWTAYILTPTKKELVLIIAGGSVGNFLQRDSSAQQIPAEITNFLRQEIKSQAKSAEVELFNTKTKLDSLKAMTKEQLIEQLSKK